MTKYYEVARDIIVIAGLIVAIYQLFQTEEGLRRSAASSDLQLAGYYLDTKKEFISSFDGGDMQKIEKAASEYGEIITMGCTYYEEGLLGDAMRRRLDEDISAMINNKGLANFHSGIREAAKDCLR